MTLTTVWLIVLAALALGGLLLFFYSSNKNQTSTSDWIRDVNLPDEPWVDEVDSKPKVDEPLSEPVEPVKPVELAEPVVVEPKKRRPTKKTDAPVEAATVGELSGTAKPVRRPRTKKVDAAPE